MSPVPNRNRSTTAMELRILCPPMRIFSGIQPSGDPHIGNSAGLPPVRPDAERGEAFFCIVDLTRSRSSTIAELREGTLDITRCSSRRARSGALDRLRPEPRDATPRRLAALAVTSYGQLGRMTQFRERSEDEEFISAALFTYPVLMAGTSCSTAPTSFRSATTSAAPRAHARHRAAIQLALRRDLCRARGVIRRPAAA